MVAVDLHYDILQRDVLDWVAVHVQSSLDPDPTVRYNGRRNRKEFYGVP